MSLLCRLIGHRYTVLVSCTRITDKPQLGEDEPEMETHIHDYGCERCGKMMIKPDDLDEDEIEKEIKRIAKHN